MEKTFKINKKHYKDILNFVELNEIKDVDVFIDKCFKKGFDIQRFGLIGNNVDIKEIEVEKIVEKIVEVPVEKIVEVIKEVPGPPMEIEIIKYVDKEVIKEVPVEKVVTKIEYISDKTTENELGEKVAELMSEMSKKDKELDELRRSLDIKPDEHKLKMLTDTLIKLKKELSEKNQEIENLKNKIKELETIKINQGAIFLKGSNLTQNL